MSDISIKVRLKNPSVALSEVSEDEYQALKDSYGAIYYVFVNKNTKDLEIGVPTYTKYNFHLSNIYNLLESEEVVPMKCAGSSYPEEVKRDKTVFLLCVDEKRRIIDSTCVNKDITLREYIEDHGKGQVKVKR